MKDLAQVKVLVIDDSSTNNLLFQSILEEEGYTVYPAYSGKEGLKIATKIVPDLILLDIMMPEMDGFDVLKVLHEKIATKHIPVIMVTARNDAVSLKKAMKLGAVDYILKPVSIIEVLDRINTRIKDLA